MALGIDMGEVYEVGFVDGSKAEVQPGSFDIDAYEFVDGADDVRPGSEGGPVTSYGFSFRTGDAMFTEGGEAVLEVMSGPMTSIAWVKWWWK